MTFRPSVAYFFLGSPTNEDRPQILPGRSTSQRLPLLLVDVPLATLYSLHFNITAVPSHTKKGNTIYSITSAVP